MKKYTLVLLYIFCMLLTGCGTRYQRISFYSAALGEELSEHISADTNVENVVNEVFPYQLPIYSITERNISQSEYDQLLGILDMPSNPKQFKLEGNYLFYNLVSYVDFDRGYFDMTDEELEKAAWDVFNKIPFIEGDYEYLGITDSFTVNDSTGDHFSRVGVSFCRVLSDTRVLGDDDCILYFDGSGLVGFSIRLFDYTNIGTMDMVTLEDAAARIKTPDDFNIDAESGVARTLQVDRIKLLLVNQYSEGCTILQPIYNFIGTATLEDGTQAEFSSKVIAIPESYTYEKIQFE